MSDDKSESPAVIYLPPSDGLIERYARNVCQKFGETHDPAINTFEVRYGLAEFLKVIASVLAKYLTKSHDTNHRA